MSKVLDLVLMHKYYDMIELVKSGRNIVRLRHIGLFVS